MPISLPAVTRGEQAPGRYVSCESVFAGNGMLFSHFKSENLWRAGGQPGLPDPPRNPAPFPPDPDDPPKPIEEPPRPLPVPPVERLPVPIEHDRASVAPS
jgi:hypothetical protein